MCFPAGNYARISKPIVWIVDARRSDYSHLLADAKAEQLEIHFLDSGRDLLHCWVAGAPDVCIVNLQLRELSGFDVIEMIRPFPEGTAVCLIADDYVPEDEIRALTLGVHSYLCKPLEAEVFFKFCLCPRAKCDSALCAADLPAVQLSLKENLDGPAKCGSKKQERRILNYEEC